MLYSHSSESSKSSPNGESILAHLVNDILHLVLIYVIIIPLIYYTTGYEITRAHAIECTIYYKLLVWLYKFLLPQIGYGFKPVNIYLEYCYHVVWCSFMYLYLIPIIGKSFLIIVAV